MSSKPSDNGTTPERQLPPLSEILSNEISAHSSTRAALHDISYRCQNTESMLKEKEDALSRSHDACNSALSGFYEAMTQLDKLKYEKKCLENDLQETRYQLHAQKQRNEPIAEFNQNVVYAMNQHIRDLRETVEEVRKDRQSIDEIECPSGFPIENNQDYAGGFDYQKILEFLDDQAP